MHYLIYLSYASADLTHDELNALLSECKRKNESRGITGILLYLDKKFFQILEGDKEAVTSLYEKIRLDERHSKASIILEGDLSSRNFPNWSMGFIGFKGDGPLKGVSNPLKLFESSAIDDMSHPAMIFAKLFYQKNKPDYLIS